jgi:hypothetical protein
MRLAVVLLVALGGMLSCGGSAPRAKPVSLGTNELAEREAERRPYAELATTRPDATSPGFWMQVPTPLAIWPKLPELLQGSPGLAPFADAQALARLVLGSEVGSVIDLSQPVDVLLPMPAADEQRFSWSFRVRSPDAVLHGDAGLTLRRVAPGVWRIGPDLDLEPQLPEEDRDEEDEYDEQEMAQQPPPPLTCQLRHFAEPVGFRVLCSGSADDVEQLAPFIAHVATLPASRADLHAELGGPPYRALLDGMVQQVRDKQRDGMSEAEKLGADIANTILEGFAQHETLGLDVSLADGKLLGTLDLTFPAQPGSELFEAWLGRGQVERLPASFAKLPPDSDLALGFGGLGKPTSRALLAVGLERFMRSLDDALIIAPKAREEMTAALLGALPEDARFSLAVGRDRAAAARVLDSDQLISADKAGKKLPAALASELQAALWGWSVVGLEVTPATYLPAIERLFKASQLPAPERPGVAEQDNARERSLLKRGATPPGLPRGTLHFIDQVRPRANYRPPADGSAPPVLGHDAHILVVPDVERVWIVLARSQALAVERAQAVLRGAAPAAASSAALGALSMNVDYLAGSDLDWDTERERMLARHLLQLTRDFPYGGKSRLPIWLDVVPRARAGAGWHLRLRTELTPNALEELVVWRGLAP